MVTSRLPQSGNVTGTPAHVSKTRSALEALGANVRLMELDIQSPASLARSFARSFMHLRKLRPDVLHVHGHLAAAVVTTAARALRIPLAVEIHGLYVPSSRATTGTRPMLSRISAALELPIARCADHVIVQAMAMRDRLVRAGVHEGRISVIYPGLRTVEFSGYDGPPAEVCDSRSDERYVVYIGSTHRYQGLDLLAASQRFLPDRYRIVLAVSRDVSDNEDVVARFGFDGQRTTVVHPEAPSALPAWTRRADVLVHARPDIPDNINVQSKLGLYLASGRPVVTTNVGDYPLLLAGAQGCIVVPPSPRALADGIIRGATDAGVRAAAQRDNPAIASCHFEAVTNAKRLLEIYGTCAAPGRGT